jgi:hypothetical protein
MSRESCQRSFTSSRRCFGCRWLVESQRGYQIATSPVRSSTLRWTAAQLRGWLDAALMKWHGALAPDSRCDSTSRATPPHLAVTWPLPLPLLAYQCALRRPTKAPERVHIE